MLSEVSVWGEGEEETEDEVLQAIQDEVLADAGAARLYPEYADDPVGFGEEVLGDRFTPDVQRVMESVRDNPVTIAISANSTGKTHGAARIATWWYKTRRGAQVYTAAAPPEKNLKLLLWGEIGSLTETSPDVFEGDVSTTLHIARSAKEFIAGVTIPSTGKPQEREARFAGKHAPYLLFIVDEGDAVPEEVYKGIESCMTGGVARLLVMFNPRHESGAVYRMIESGQGKVIELSAMSHPNVVTGENQIPGAVDRETTVRRINEWTRPLAPDEEPDGECFEVPAYLEGYEARRKDGAAYPPLMGGWRKVIEQAFWYMVLAQYPSQGTQQLIAREWISAARARWDAYVARFGERPPEGSEGVGGLDVAEYGSDKSSLAVRWGGFVDRIRTWEGVDPDTTAIRAAGYLKADGVSTCCTDATGVGAGVPKRMQRLGIKRSVGVKVASRATKRSEHGAFYQLRDQLYWELREWLRTDPGAMLPPDEELLEELRVPTYEVKKGTIRVTDKDTMKELLGRSPDKMESVVMTVASPASISGGAVIAIRTGAGSPLVTVR